MTTAIAEEFRVLCDTSDHIDPVEISRYASLMESHDDRVMFTVLTNRFGRTVCPTCGTDAYFKMGYFGDLRHPECGRTWVAPVGVYTSHQASEIGMAYAVTRGFFGKGRPGQDRIEGLVGFFFGVTFGLAAMAVRTVLAAMLVLTVALRRALADRKAPSPVSVKRNSV